MGENASKSGVYGIFAIVTVTCALGSLTQTVMNSMLLGVQQSFGTPESVSQWLTTVYMLVIGITVPLVSHLSRKMSLRGLTLLAICFFFAGAVIDFIAPEFWALLVGRILQAVATGITLPTLTTIAMTRFPPGKNGTAMGIAGIAMGFAPNIGPLIGGALVTTLGWRSFYMMLAGVLVILAMITVVAVRKEPFEDRQAKLDFISFVQSTFGFGGLLIGFTNAASMPFTDVQVVVPLLLGAAFLIAFVARQNRIGNPLISMEIFKAKNYGIAFTLQNFLFASYMGITLILPLFVQNVCGMSALDAGIVFIPATIFAVIVNPLAGVLYDRIGARKVVVGAAILLTIGAVSMVFVDAQTTLWELTLMQTIRVLGVSALIGPLNSWGMSKLPHTMMMDGSAFFATVRQACASFGTALMMLVISIGAAMAAAGADAAFGYQLAFGLSALFSVVVLVLSAAKVR